MILTGGGMLRPRKMKHLELTVLSRDIEAVIEFLGRGGYMHFTHDDEKFRSIPGNESVSKTDDKVLKLTRENLEKLKTACAYLGIAIPAEPLADSHLPGTAEEELTKTITAAVSALSGRENELIREKARIGEALNETKAFAGLDAPFSDLDQLSYLTLRVGRLDPRQQADIKQNLSGRAVIIPLDGDRVMAASSRKGRFALDSELKKSNFIPINIPEGFKGVPAELISGFAARLENTEDELRGILEKKKEYCRDYGNNLQSLIASYIMAGIMNELKAAAISTENFYLLSGWTPAGLVSEMAAGLEKITGGSIAIRSCNPDEIESVSSGSVKVPVSLKHRGVVKGFESVIFSYGVPLYGAIDPTIFVTIFFTLMFGIMFGDIGQGLVLLLLGILTGKKGPAFMARFRKFSVPLIAVGTASMVMGFLEGSIFTNDKLLIGVTRAITGFLTGHPADKILVLMPMAEMGGSVTKLFYFFGFTIGIGIILNSIGLILNMVNLAAHKDYVNLFFSKTGIAGSLFFWYAISLGVRAVIGIINPLWPFGIFWYDKAALIIPIVFILFGPTVWRLAFGTRPVLAEGLMVFVMESFVEVLETISNYFSNTVSFLRVGAFALSHAVLSYIIFSLSGQLMAASGGTLIAGIIMVFGNSVIIVLEGMIVAIQVMRLQYYEFFGKFFTETGVEFKPFRFRKGVEI
ncbi:MAG: V-type ATP synthase subunit I [Treponema sp.]|nr:V-type ATP synthase subunit I [Treponema sp.]